MKGGRKEERSKAKRREVNIGRRKGRKERK